MKVRRYQLGDKPAGLRGRGKEITECLQRRPYTGIWMRSPAG